MRLLKTTACFLLLLQTLDLATPQTTSRPRHTIDPSWLRLQTADPAALQTTSRPRATIDQSWLRQPPAAAAASAFSGDGDSTTDSSETASGALDEEASTNANQTDNKGASVSLNGTNQEQPPTETNRSESLNSTQTNTTAWSETNATSAESALNTTDVPAATPSGHNDTVNSTMASNNHTGPNATLTVTVTVTVTPQQNATTDASTASAMVAGGVTDPVPDVTARVNVNDQGSGDGSGRGGGSVTYNSSRKVAWAVVLGIGVVLAVVGLVVYVAMKRKQRKDFFHRKLVEEFPSDPVHRLDNDDSLDLEFGRSAFYNPTLQEDDIQMSNLPKRA